MAEKIETVVVNLIGSPGSGKTTLTALLFAELKLRGKIVEYVPEYAKKLVWLQDWESLNNQHHVSTRQFKLMKSMQHKVEFITTDGSLLHGLYYNRYNQANTSDKDITENKILEYYRNFKNINIYLQRGDFEYEQAGRIQTEAEAKEIDVALRAMLDKHEIKYRIFKSSTENIAAMTNYVLQMAAIIFSD